MGTGGNMGRQGTPVYWLLTMLNLVSGNLGRPGGGLLKGQPPSEHFDELPERFFASGEEVPTQVEVGQPEAVTPPAGS